MTVNPSGWRPTTPANEQGEARTITGNRALMLEEPLLFEIGSIDQTGVDFDSSSPLVGEERGGGREPLCSPKKNHSAADAARPHPNPSPQGGGASDREP